MAILAIIYMLLVIYFQSNICRSFDQEVYLSLLEIKCPMCKGSLWIDPGNGKVIDHKPVDHKKADFGEFLKNNQKGKDWEDKLQKAKDKEAKRKAELEEKFKQAREDPDKLDGEYQSPFQWD